MAHPYQNPRLISMLKWIFVAIVVLLPFHGFLTTWVGSNFGELLFWRAWKELLLVPVAIGATWLIWHDQQLRRLLFGRLVNKLILIFAVWLLFTTILLNHDGDSALLGLSIQLRLFTGFLLAQILVFYRAITKRQIVLLILVPAVGVVVFGLLQIFILPFDFLRHFGYEKGISIPPFFTIDEQLGKFRIASTLRGPNPLGVYLILPAMLAVSSWQKVKSKKDLTFPILLITFFLLLIVVLYASHSRGAWLGFAAALATWILLKVPKIWKIGLITIAIISSAIIGAGIYNYRHTNFVQDVVLHDNPDEGGKVSSNAGHIDALWLGLNDVASSPLVGCGAGCAGPASVHNSDGVKLAENYFVQTAQEGGLVALVLLLTIFGLVAWALYLRTDDLTALALLSAFVGISVASLLAHAWADDTIAYLWWAVAGIVLYNGTKGKQENGQKKKNNLDTAA